MKKYLLLAVSFCSLSFSSPMQDRAIDPAALSELCLALNISDNDIIRETQQQWLRKPGQERWELTELSLEQKRFVLDWAEKQGLFAPWKPACDQYDEALILGATTSRMQMRLDYLKKLWMQGTRFEKIVFLTGERPLDNRVDDFTDLCKNESEAAQILWENASLPDEMRRLPVIFISVPMKKEGSTLKRPNTQDTILAWLQTTLKTGSALFVSDQPFCGYQFAVIKTCLPDSVLFDLVGEGADPASHPAAAAITLDSIARWIYQEHIAQKSLGRF